MALKIGDKNVIKLAYGTEKFEQSKIGKYILVQLPTGSALEINRIDTFNFAVTPISRIIYNGEKYPIVGEIRYFNNTDPYIIIKVDNQLWVAGHPDVVGKIIEE